MAYKKTWHAMKSNFNQHKLKIGVFGIFFKYKICIFLT